MDEFKYEADEVITAEEFCILIRDIITIVKLHKIQEQFVKTNSAQTNIQINKAVIIDYFKQAKQFAR